MRCRSCAGFALLLWTLTLSGCQDRKTIDDLRPLPTPEPPASAAPLTPRVDPAPTVKKPPAPVDAGKEPVKTKPADGANAAPTPTVAPTVTATPTASTTSTATAGAPAALPSVPPLVAPSAACLSRCQGAMQGCLSAPVDGGVPGFANLDLCKKAFEACQAACK